MSSSAVPMDTSFLDAYAGTYRFRLGIPKNVVVTADETMYFLRSEARSFTHELFTVDMKTGQESLFLTAAALLDASNSVDTLSEEEKARRERMRQASRGIASYTLSPDQSTLLIPLGGRLFLVSRANSKVTLLQTASTPLDATFSPNGLHLAYVSQGDIYLYTISTGQETRVTTAGEQTDVTCGLPEFVACEEMDRYQGYWWNPSGRELVYQLNDDTKVEKLTIMDPTRPEKAAVKFAYPRPGKINTAVSLYSVKFDQEDVIQPAVQIMWDTKAIEYVAQVTWAGGKPLILVQNRAQNVETLLLADTITGNTTTVLTETDSTWVNLDQGMPLMLADGKSFLWTTERNGGWQVEIRSLSDPAAVPQPITQVSAGYRSIVACDAENIVFLGGPNPSEQHLYRVPYKVDSSAAPQEAVTLTTGAGSYSCAMFDTCAVLSKAPLKGDKTMTVVDRATLLAGPTVPTVELFGLKLVTEPIPFPVNLEIVTVDHELKFKAAILKPQQFDETQQYPVVVYVYGGPHHRTVVADQSAFAFQQWIANHGFIVVTTDGRGTPYRGREWERAIHNNFITVPMEDQVASLQALAKDRPYMDMNRVGIYGWSFGGYFSALAVMLSGHVYHAAFSGAPVSTWEDYDTHYTERYIGTPEENVVGYEDSCVMTHAAKLSQPLCIVHGTADDNVYFSHAIKMSNALFKANKDHEFLPLVDFTHMVTDPVVVRALYGKMLRFLVKNVQNRTTSATTTTTTSA